MSRTAHAFAALAAAAAFCLLTAAFAPPANVGGTVKSISADKGEITLTIGSGKTAKEQVFRVTASSKITLDGKPTTLKDITEGTKVTLSYDKASNEVVSIRVSGTKSESAEKPESDSTPAPAKPARSASGKPAAPAAGASANLTGEWPQWRGPDRNAVSRDTGLMKQWPKDGPPLVWKVAGVGSGYSSVAVTGGRIYTTGDRGGNQVLTCLDTADGKEIWATPIGQSGGARSTPTVDGELLFALSTRGNQDAQIVCLETATGKEVWRKNFKDFGGRMQTSWGYSESPLVDGDNVICTPGGSEATLLALQKKTGEVVWKAKVPGGDAAAYSSIVVADVGGIRQYVQLLEKGIVGVAAKDGKFLWRYDRIANGTANIPTPIVRGDLVFCSTGYNTGAALLKLTPAAGGIRVEEKYFLKGNEFQNHHGGMVLVGDYIYAGSGHTNGLPTCIELKTGKMAWGPLRGPGEKSAAVVYADGNLYFRYENAVMALIEASPKGYKVKGSFPIPDGSTPSWSHPVIAGGRLYLRDQDRMLCYDVRANPSTAQAGR